MPKHSEKILLLAVDFLALSASFFAWAWFRREMGFFAESDTTTLFIISSIVNVSWILLFAFFGMYAPTYARSRVDEFISVFKTVTIGVLVVFLITFEGESDLSTTPKVSRMFIMNYWVILLIVVTTGRMTYRTLQKAILARGIGHRRTLIVGWGELSWDLSDRIRQFPALGYDVIGFLSEKKHETEAENHHNHIPLLGSVKDVETVVHKMKVQEVILALRGKERKKVMELVDLCNGYPVNFKIVPDLYDIVLGQARTNQIYGFPLIAIHSTVMLPWEQRIKNLFDMTVSAAVLLFFLPVWLMVAFLIKIDSKGPALYRQTRVGKNGRHFEIYKFRSMMANAESKTGPQWATKSDPRITRIGKWIRRLRIDEVPQLINVLKGEMSLIGPRPERPFFVEKFKKEIPFYTRRLRVKPGITGWAQIKGGYDESFENVKNKLQYDLFYLENMSLRMDLKVIINTIYVMLMGKGQ